MPHRWRHAFAFNAGTDNDKNCHCGCDPLGHVCSPPLQPQTPDSLRKRAFRKGSDRPPHPGHGTVRVPARPKISRLFFFRPTCSTSTSPTPPSVWWCCWVRSLTTEHPLVATTMHKLRFLPLVGNHEQRNLASFRLDVHSPRTLCWASSNRCTKSHVDYQLVPTNCKGQISTLMIPTSNLQSGLCFLCDVRSLTAPAWYDRGFLVRRLNLVPPTLLFFPGSYEGIIPSQSIPFSTLSERPGIRQSEVFSQPGRAVAPRECCYVSLMSSILIAGESFSWARPFWTVPTRPRPCQNEGGERQRSACNC